jgi:hypothetical protein
VLGSAISGSGEQTVLIYNRQPSRQLQLNGRSPGDDIVVGSPGTSELLSGGSGNNTFVVGNQPARLAVDPKSGTPYLVSSTNETDRLSLISTGIDYINIKPNGQSVPGTITVANSQRLTTVTRPIPNNNPPDGVVRNCPPATAQRISPTAPPVALLAMAPSASSPLLSLFSNAGVEPAPPADMRLAQAGNLDGEIEGVPEVIDFDLNVDQIILSDELAEGISNSQPDNPYIYANYSSSSEHRDPEALSQAGENTQTIPILVLKEIRFTPVMRESVLCKKELSRMLDTSKGLPNIPTNLAPLVYFQEQGLLVSITNKGPLGSRVNPGRVVARLLNGNGSALKLPVPPGSSIYQSSFVSFQPRNVKEQPCNHRYTSRGYQCPGGRNYQSAMAPALP